METREIIGETGLRLKFNGIEHTYTIEVRDLTDDGPDYLNGEWICLVDHYWNSEKVIKYVKSAGDAAMVARSASLHADAEQAVATATQWMADVLEQVKV